MFIYPPITIESTHTNSHKHNCLTIIPRLNVKPFIEENQCAEVFFLDGLALHQAKPAIFSSEVQMSL